MSEAPTVLPPEVDAVVCGGGPGGSTAATVLARAGLSVALFERERFPRFHVGESLLPFNLPLLERLGVHEKVAAARFQVKYGARFYHQGSDHTRFIRFANSFDGAPPSAYQVKRAEFDLLLLHHARESGAAVHEGARVEEVLFEGTRATGVRVRLAGEAVPREVRAKVVVDATGRDALLSNVVGGRVRDPWLDRSGIFAHFDRFGRAEGPEGGDIVIVTTPDGWWWLIPFADGSVSVGVVMPSRRLKERTGSVEELYEAARASTPEVSRLLEGATRTTQVHHIADYSYTTAALRGDGFVLVGDAACFLDPVFSTGVLMAMTSGEMAGLAIAGALRRKGRVDAADFAPLERLYRRAVRRFRAFVHGFYQPHVLETFYTPAPHVEIERAVTTVLAGGVFAPSLKSRFWAAMFHVSAQIVRLQQAMRGKGPFERATGIVTPAP